MADQETITGSLELLRSHRRTLRVLLNQEALAGEAAVPPAVASGIDDARAEIARLKADLRGWGVAVDDEAGDTALPARPQPARLAGLPPLAWAAVGAGLALLLAVLVLLTRSPAASPAPTPIAAPPTSAPTSAPTIAPTAAPTAEPTVAPTVAPTAAPTSAPTAQPSPARAPEFVGRYPLNVAALELIEYVPEPGIVSAQPITDALTVTELEFGELVGESLPGWNIRLRFTNTRAEPVVLDLSGRFFRLDDDQGRAADLVYFCCPADGELLGAGESRELQLFFRSNADWFGKEVSARQIFIRVTGLLPIRRAVWSFPPLATAN